MRMLAGLLKPDEGSASVLGLDPIKDDGALHAMLGYMPQKFGLYEDLTVMENLNLYADLRSVTGETREKTFARLLEFTSLGPFTDRLAGKLSGGMKQKLGLACTLVGEPKVLLLDEPGVGVDPISRRELWQMVHELAGDGMLILWSTSYLDEAEQCRDVLLMNEGELLYQGEPTTLTQSMAGRSFLLHSPQESNRSLLQRVLRLPQVSDGMIQGRSVRVILKKRPPSTIFAGRLECRRLRWKRRRRVLKMRSSTCWAARGPPSRRLGRSCTRWKVRRAKR
jgi:ABC-2 type transport system ATP-binding protein